MDLACPRHGCGSLEHFVPAASVGEGRRRVEQATAVSCVVMAVSYPLRAGAAGGPALTQSSSQLRWGRGLIPCPFLASWAAELGGSHELPQATSRPESADKIAGHSKIKPGAEGRDRRWAGFESTALSAVRAFSCEWRQKHAVAFPNLPL